MYDFIKVDEGEIKTSVVEDYSDFFDKNFMLDLISILSEKDNDFDFNQVSIIDVFKNLQYASMRGSYVLDYFARNYDISKCNLGMSSHPLYDAIKNYLLLENKKNSQKNKELSIQFPYTITTALKTDSLKSNEQFKKMEFDDSVWDLLDDIQKKFVGQEVAVEELFYNIINNQQLVDFDDFSDGQRSIIFMDGPTGTGKTAIAREITEKLGLPFIATTITNYSSTGYVGGDILDVLIDLYKKADNNLEKAQRGIIVFDEFDKIASSNNDGIEMRKAVQQQLLDFMGGGKYIINTSDNVFDSSEVEFDTSKLTFICLGALTDLRTKKQDKGQAIGFGSVTTISCDGYNITPQDLIDIGLERELVGRFNTYLHTEEYSRDSLKKILIESTISPLIGFKKWIESRGKKLVIDDDVYDLIVDQAYQLNTGARSLQTIVNGIRTKFLKEVFRGNSDVIYLNSEVIMKINNQTMYRKGRR